MPIHEGRDIHGMFFQWGNSGKRYYYIPSSASSRKHAHERAIEQMKAIYSRGYRE